MSKYFYSSVTRISDLAEEGFKVAPLPRGEWGEADYVVGEVVSRAGALARVELRSGRMIEVVEGDLVIGAFGSRRATLDVVGDWRDIRSDSILHALTAGGLFGRATSVSPRLPPLMRLRYQGHVWRDGEHLSMANFVREIPEATYDAPTILIIGTSMSAGKTTSAKRIIRHLNQLGLGSLVPNSPVPVDTEMCSPCGMPEPRSSTTSSTSGSPQRPWIPRPTGPASASFCR